MSAIEARFAERLGSFGLDVAFTAPARGVTALFGPSGCGKTTVLRCVAGLHHPAAGRLVVDGEPWQDDAIFLPPHRRAVGYVFQEASLFPHLSVRANLDYGRRRAGGRSTGIALDEVVGMLGLAPLLDRPTEVLSGGERQRVAIGRALMSRPRLLLMDEPLAALDRDSKDDILRHLEGLRDILPIPVLYVSHAIGEVERLADHLVAMEAGRVLAAGPIADMLADLRLPFARDSRAGVVLTATVAGYDPVWALTTLEVAGATLTVPGRLGPAGTATRLRVLATDVSLARTPPAGTSILNTPPARVEETVPHDAAQMTVRLRLGDGGTGAWLLARVTRRSWESLGLAPGAAVVAQIKGVAIATRDRLD